MPRTLKICSLILLLAVPVLAGCDGDSGVSESDSTPTHSTEQNASAAIRELDQVVRTSFEQGDFARFCSSLTEELGSQYAQAADTCEQGAAQIAESMGGGQSFPAVKAVRVNGKSGRIAYENGTVYEVERKDGEWLLGSFAGSR